ncbi:MAG TPA: tetratricopeptide repeat protein, partial [Terriglobales bacterium]|nr:tetratricopeptide repeat protein [Terriglobales bacterium]
MKTTLGIAILALLGAPASPVQASQNSNTKANQASGSKATQASASSTKIASDTTDQAARADLYYYFAMGHLNEQQYELTGRSEQAAESIDFYKKALALQPGSPVIMERLAEIYAKSQRIRDAVAQAQEVLKIDPNSLAAHRLLARIYVRTLGDANAGELQKENLAKAVEQFNAILKLDPKDTSSALWL